MTAMRITAFSGRAPRTMRRLLADNQAQVATNCRLTNGQLQPMAQPLAVNDPQLEGPISMYRMESAGVEKWLTWALDVDVARGPIEGDTLQRIYWTGDGEPRMSHFSLATSGVAPYPTAWYVLGVTPPTVAPTVTPSGGASSTLESRAYVYRFKTALGEASAPSPASTVTSGKVDDTWGLTGMQAAPPNSYTITAASWSGGVLTLTVNAMFGARAGERVALSGLAPAALNAEWPIASVVGTTTVTIAMDDPGSITDQTGTATRVAPHNTTGMTKEIYRTITGANGNTEYRFVATVAVGTTTYNDTIASSVVALNEQLDSDLYELPPVDAKGMIALPNGIMACFSKNIVCLSEPFKPHAWPSIYRQTVNYTIVGIGYFGTTLVIATTGNPYMLTGVEPSTMGGGMAALNVEWPCLSKRGLVSVPWGVMYPAPQGVAVIGAAGPEIATREFFTEVEWRDLAPTTFVAAMRDNRYYAAYEMGTGQRRVLIIDKGEVAPVTDINITIEEFWTDPASGKLYVVQNDLIYEWDAYVDMSFDWMSKEFVVPSPINMGAAKVDAEFTASAAESARLLEAQTAVIAANQAMIDAGYIGGGMTTLPVGYLPVNGNLLGMVPRAPSLQFHLFTNNQLRFSKTILSGKPFKLPSGYRADAFAVRLAGEIKVNAVVVGKTMDDLKGA